MELKQIQCIHRSNPSYLEQLQGLYIRCDTSVVYRDLPGITYRVWKFFRGILEEKKVRIITFYPFHYKIRNIKIIF